MCKVIVVVVQIVGVFEVVYVVGIVYCDLKLVNIKIFEDFQVKVFDFGLVKLDVVVVVDEDEMVFVVM